MNSIHKLEARKTFPNMPEDIFLLWLDERIDQNGWPPNGFKWNNILRNHSIDVWKQIKWTKKNIKLNWSILSNDTKLIINKLQDVNILGKKNELSNIGDSQIRIINITNYLFTNRKLPSTLIFLEENNKFEIVDGCHRLMVYFTYNKVPNLKDKIIEDHLAWVGYGNLLSKEQSS